MNILVRFESEKFILGDKHELKIYLKECLQNEVYLLIKAWRLDLETNLN